MLEELKRRSVGQEDISKVHKPTTLSAYAASPVDPGGRVLSCRHWSLANTTLNSLRSEEGMRQVLECPLIKAFKLKFCRRGVEGLLKLIGYLLGPYESRIFSCANARLSAFGWAAVP